MAEPTVNELIARFGPAITIDPSHKIGYGWHRDGLDISLRTSFKWITIVGPCSVDAKGHLLPPEVPATNIWFKVDCTGHDSSKCRILVHPETKTALFTDKKLTRLSKAVQLLQGIYALDWALIEFGTRTFPEYMRNRADFQSNEHVHGFKSIIDGTPGRLVTWVRG